MPEEKRPWVSLQIILNQYLEMIDLEKVKGLSEDSDSESDDEVDEGNERLAMKQLPWVLQPHSDKTLDRTSAAYRSLIRAIEDRMPKLNSGSSPSSPPRKRRCGSSPVHALNLTKEEDFIQAISNLATSNQVAKDSFIKFLHQSIRPSRQDLKFIAPGFRLPTAESLSNQPFKNIDFHTSSYYNPILLIPAKSNDDSPYTTTFPNQTHNPFPYPYDQNQPTCPSGLWISETNPDDGAFDDACRFLLPRHIIDRHADTEPEPKHYARSTDGFVLEARDGDSESLAAGLYQTSCNPFIPRHEVELFRVLESWVGMVVSRAWEVGSEGVVGGVERWRDADESLEGSGRYRLSLTW